jgi:Fic-DOC domain mobile mystery protein B
MDFLLKARDGQTPLPPELLRGLRIKTIQTVGELDEHEEENLAGGLIWLSRQTRDPTDYAFWLELHRRLFGKVWSWAGKVRTHELENEQFGRQANIWTALRQLEGDLRFWTSEHTFPPEELLARFHERIETVHPFPNGNGRFGRILAEHLARHWGWQVPTWGHSLAGDQNRRRTSYIEAITTARREGDYHPLISFMFS